MPWRLFKPVLARCRGFCAAATFVVAGCGGAKFVASDSASGATETAGGSADNASSAGADENAGAGGSATAGASAGGRGGMGAAGASAGSGGKPAGICDCAAGSYCQAGTKTCRPCTDFSVLSFAAPEKLATLSQTGNHRFPRPASAGSDLFYRLGKDGNSSLWYAPAPISGVGRPLLAAAGVDSGPLLASNPPQNFYFDQVEAMTNLRQIMYGTWSTGALTKVDSAPAPLNSGSGDFSVAIAERPGRAYWMSSRNQKPAPELLWATLAAGDTTPAVLDIKVKAGESSKCPRQGDDATPWVNAEGTLLLFRSESVDEKCTVNDGGAYDLFAVSLSAEGAPLAPAIPLSSLNNTGGMSSETDPALSQDSCTIYFASDHDRAGDFDLYSAARN